MIGHRDARSCVPAGETPANQPADNIPMSIQKYRFDITEQADAYGVVVLKAKRMGDTTVAGIRNCFCGYYGRRTAYVTGVGKSYSTIPAAIQVNGRRINGWVGCLDGRWEFHRGPILPSPLSKPLPLY
jgi:hypothetical protein